jgi:hypothetical protein
MFVLFLIHVLVFLFLIRYLSNPYFPCKKWYMLVLFLTKMCLATFWANFFANSSGHPVSESLSKEVPLWRDWLRVEKKFLCFKVRFAKTIVLLRTGLPDGVGLLKPNIQIWINFGGPWNGKFWYILWPCEIYYGHLVYFWPFGNLVVIWYIFPRFGILNQTKIWQPWLRTFFGRTTTRHRNQLKSLLLLN